jgi:TPR repeat protein
VSCENERCFVFFFFFFQAREENQSGLVLFHEAIHNFDPFYGRKESFARFERAAAKGHEDSIWIVSVWKDVTVSNPLEEAFMKTETPLGWYFAARLLIDEPEERFNFVKKSAEGGCSWGQAQYAWDLGRGVGGLVDVKAYFEWLETAANQNNPLAIYWLGNWFRGDGADKEKAVAYYRAAAELGGRRRGMSWPRC